MVGKNNKQARWSKSANTFKRYSLKKLSVGVASVVIGTGVAWASSTTVHAAEEGTEVVTGDGEKEEPVESAVPTEAPVVGGDDSSSHDAVADLVNEISAAEEPASEAADVVEPRGVSESSDNDYEPIPSDAIEGAAETSDEEKDAGGEDKINEERHTEEASLEKEDKDSAEEKLDNEEFQGSFLRSARQTRRRGPGGSTNTGGNSGSTTATRNEPEEPAVEILSASKLPQNPPVFYANEQTGGAVNRDTGLNTVRTTGILAGTFFPEGTKFRLKDNRFTFDKGADAQKKGGNEGQWSRETTIGWFGPSRSGVVGQQTNPEKLLTPSAGKKATPMTPHPNNHPYVVRDTGQILFGLGNSAVKGERINVPMVAEWKDPETGRTHQWEFFQGIQVGDAQVANRRQKPDNEKDWVFVGETPAENERQSGNVKIGTRDNVVGQNFGWYGQKMGDIGEWIERKNVPKFRPTLADIAEDVQPKYGKLDAGVTTSGEPTFHAQGNEAEGKQKPNGTKFSLGNGAPAGAKINSDTGVVSFDQPVAEETTVPVKVTYQDGSSDNTNVVFKPAAKKTNEEVEPKYENPAPGMIKSGQPTFYEQDTETEVTKPENTIFAKGENAPEGVSVDSETGVVTLDKPVETETKVPVKVTYSDDSEETVYVTFTPAKDTTAPSIESIEDKEVTEGSEIAPIQVNTSDDSGEAPTVTVEGLPDGLTYENGTISGTPAKIGEGQPREFDVTVKSTDGSGNEATETFKLTVKPVTPAEDTTAPTIDPIGDKESTEGSEIDPIQVNTSDDSGEAPTVTVEGLPDGLTYENGTISGTPAKIGEGQPREFDVTVKSTDGSGNEATETFKLTVKPVTPAEDTTAPTIDPIGDKESTEGSEIDPIQVNTSDDSGEAPTVTVEGLPDGLTYENGTISGTPAKIGEGQPREFDVTVKSTDGSGNEATETFKLTVKPVTPAEDTTAPTIDPIGDKESTEGSEIDPIQVNTSDDSGEAPTVTVEGLPDGLTYENGTISGTPAKIGEGQPREFDVTVKSTDGSGNEATETFKLTVKPAAPSISGYEDKTITEGRPIEPITPEITNKGEGDITANGLPDGLSIDPETGKITGTPDVKDWKDNFDKENSNSSDFEEERDFTVTVTVPGQPERTAEFTITVQRDTDDDGTADVNDPDSDGDGINDNVELKRGTNPKDADDFKGPELSVNTPKKDEETVSGKTEPDTPVTVKDTDETVIGQGVSDEEGNFEVPVNRPLKGGEELDVTAGAPDNDKDQTTERVTVDTPDNEEYEPKWEDTNAEDGKRVVVPNTGDEIPAGSTTTATITEDPNNKGKANWTVTVDDNGDVEVTPGSDAQPGDSATVTVETTYPDGTKDSSSFKVTVPTIQSFEYDPQGQDIEVPEGAEPNAADGIANKDELPEGTEFEFDGPVDTSTPGEKKAKVIVAYPDGSTDTVDVTVNVTEVPTQADKYEPKGNPIFVEKNGTPNAADGIANKDELPEGTEFEFDGPVDTSTPGEKKAKVIVAYPDGSTDAVDVTVNVTDGDTPQSEIFEPQGQDIKVPEGGQPNAADGIANKDELPEGTEFEFDGPVDTSTPGKKKAKVIVAYPDGSTDTVDVTVNVTPKAPGKTTAETLEPKWNDSDAKDGGPVTVPNTGDKIPAGSKTTATITEDPNNKGKANWTVTVGEDGSVTVTPGADAQPGDSATVTVETTYPDGSKDSSSFKVTVPEKGKTTAETLEPKWNDSDAKDGGPVTVPNTGDKIPAGSTTTATITEDPNNKGKANWTVTVGEDGSVTVTPGADAQPGDSATVTVETTYPDGSKDSSSFKVTVPAVGPTHAHGDSLVHDKPSYDLDKLGHGQTQPSRPAEDKGQGQVQDKAQTPAVDKAGLPNYVPSQSGERLPDTATGAWVLGVVGLMSTGLGSALGLKRKKEDEE